MADLTTTLMEAARASKSIMNVKVVCVPLLSRVLGAWWCALLERASAALLFTVRFFLDSMVLQFAMLDDYTR